MARLAMALFVLTLAACSGDRMDVVHIEEVFASSARPVIAKPLQDEATRLVWVETYHQGGLPPAVVWRDPDASCGGIQFVETNPDGQCVFGEYYVAGDWVEMAWGGRFLGNGPGNLTPFAHELAHAASFADTGDADADHVGEYFMGKRVAEANEALRQANL